MGVTPETRPSEPEIKDDVENAIDKGLYNYCEDIYGNQPAIIDGWLRLYGAPTVNDVGRSVLRHEKANKFDWAMPEEVEDINKYARIQIELNGGSVIINANEQSNANIFTDAEGRYWVAVGPRVMEPNVDLTKVLTVDDFAYGTKMDIHVQDEDGNEYYIPAVLGDIKAHSAPDGLYQTGIQIPSNETIGQNADGSTVEFLGKEISKDISNGKPKSSVNRTNKYRLLDIIVYDEVLNY